MPIRTRKATPFLYWSPYWILLHEPHQRRMWLTRHFACDHTLNRKARGQCVGDADIVDGYSDRLTV